jgi:hypothetical protein
MDLSKLSSSDLQALQQKNLTGISTEGLKYLQDSMKPQPSREEIESKQGFIPAAKEGFNQFVTSAEEGLGERFNSDLLRNLAEKRKADSTQGGLQYIPTTSEDIDAASKEGLFSLAGAAARKYITEPLGGIVGRYGAPIAAGAAATGLAALAAPEAVASGVGLLGTGLLGKGVTSLADLPAEVGEIVQRQRETGKEVDATSATAYGLVSAALAGFGIPGLGKLAAPVQKVFSNEANVLAKKVLEGMPKEQALAQLNGTLKNIVLGSGEAAVTGAGLMVGTEAAHRAGAGQGVTSPEAIEAYKQQALGAAEMAPIFGALHGIPKLGKETKVLNAAADKYAEKKRLEDNARKDAEAAAKGVEDRARADAEAAALAEEQHAQEFKEKQAAAMGPAENAVEGIQGHTADIFGEQNRIEGPAKGKQAFGKMEGDVSPFEPSLEAQQKAGQLVDKGISDNAQIQQLQQQLDEVRRAQTQGTTFKPLEITDFDGNKQTLTDPGALRGREAFLERQIEALKQPSTQDLIRQRNVLFRTEEGQEKGHIPELQQRISDAAGKGDIDTIAQLSPQLAQAQKAHTDLLAQLKKAAPVEESPEVKAVTLRGQIKNKTEQLKKLSGAEGNFDKIHKLAGEIKDLQEQLKSLPEYGPDLFAQDEANRAKNETENKEAFAQQQQDLLAQLGKSESRDQTNQRQVLDRYQESLQQLEDAHAANADKRIIDALVEKVREASVEKANVYAKTSETPDVAKEEALQVKQERIKRAIAEAEAKGDTASVDGLKKQLAKAIVEGASPNAVSRRSRALEDQQAAIEEIRSQVEDLKSGRFLGEGTRDTATAASMRQGIEQKANESIGRYAEATIREVNAVREQNGTKRLTNTEAIRLAMDVRGHLENAVRNLNEPALRMPKEGTVSTLEKQLAQIKKKHHKGPAIEKARGPEVLKTEVDTLRRRQQTGEKIDGGKPFETEARKAERLAEEKAEAERVERSGVNPDQKSLFGEKDLEPVATTRASTGNFIKLLNSSSVAKLRARAQKLDGVANEIKAVESKAKKMGAVDQNYVAAYDRLKMLGDTAAGLQKSLYDLWTAPSKAKAAVKEAKAKIVEQVKSLDALKEKESALVRKLEGPTAEPVSGHQKITDINSDLAVNRKKQAGIQSDILKQGQEVKRLQAAVDAVYANRPQQLEVYRTIRKGVESRIKELQETKLRAEQELQKNAWDRARQKIKEATTEAEKNRLTTEQEKTQRRSEEQIESTKRALKEQENIIKRGEEQAKIERTEALPVVKQEVIETEFKAPGQADRVLRKKITRDDRTPEEKRADKLAAEREQQKQLAERREPARQRQKLGDALKQESELNKQLKALQAEQGKLVKAKESIEKALAAAKTEKSKNHWQMRLEETRKAIEAAEFGKREQVLKSGIDQLKDVGVKAERALTIFGNKAGRETQTRVKGPEKSPEDRERARLERARAKDIKSSFDHYLESEKRDPYEYYEGLSGIKLRAEKEAVSKINPEEALAVSEKIEKSVPKDVTVKSVAEFDDLPESIKDTLSLEGITEESGNTKTVRGFVTPEGEIYVIRGNHESAKDLEKTYVHEIIGHEGVDRILGEEGMKKLADRINGQKGSMEALAKELDVLDQVQGALNDAALGIEQLTKKKASKEVIDKAMKDMETTAIRELIAYTSEKRVTENLPERVKRWLKELVGAVRAGLRSMGFFKASEMTTSDIYHLIRQAQRNYNNGRLGAMRESGGTVKFAKNKAVYNQEYNTEMVKMSDRFVAKQQSTTDKIKSYALGMSFMHRFTDQYAGLNHIAKNMGDSLKGMQMMYFNRLYNQNTNMTAEIATHGPVGIKVTKGSKESGDAEYQYVSKKTGGLSPILSEIGKSAQRIGNTQAALNQFSLYMAAERIEGLAKSKNISISAAAQRLNLRDEFTPEEMSMVLKDGRGDKNFQAAREKYRTYNNGLLDLLVDTGRLSEDAAAELKQGDYIPFYRERDGEVWDNEYNISIGNIKNQPYLKELVGGDKPIISFEVSALQNTHMLTEMAMRNIATKNTAHTLRTLGIAEIHDGKGPPSPDVVRFYDKGKEQYARLNTKDAFTGMEERLDAMREAGKAGTEEYKKLRERAEKSRESSSLFGNIPAELIVRGMEGTGMTMPAAISFLRGPSNLLRKFVTRNPLYALRVLQKDSIDSWVRTGADVNPITGALANVKKAMEGGEEVRGLQSQGITGGHVYSGTLSDMRTIAMQIAEGKPGWEQKWAKLDRMAMIADEAARVNLYNGFIKKGLSPMEASLATLEAQNFTKHGYSPTMRMLTVMIPFFNAQVSGLNNFVTSMAGKSLFEDKLNVRTTMLKRGALLAGSTMLYSALVQNTKAYKDATETERLNNWFIPLPGTEEMLRVGIPYESGFVFKALAEAVLNLMSKDEKAKDVLPAVRDALLSNIPGFSGKFMPQGVKPLIEGYTNKDFFTGAPIESDRQLTRVAGERYTPKTTEAAKLLGGKVLGPLLGISPLQIDHAISGYTSGTGLALLSMFNPALRTSAEPPTGKLTDMPFVGGMFQPADGRGFIEKAYNDAKTIDQINNSYKDKLKTTPKEAEQFLKDNLKQISSESASGSFKKQMASLADYERAIRASNKTPSEKQKEIERIKEFREKMAKQFISISRE